MWNILKKGLIHPVKRNIAKYYLIFLRQVFGLKVIGITGSSGKTSTKDMLMAILKQKGKTVASFANIDPVYNIPTTILRCTPNTKYLILEMGIEYLGEMNLYMWLAKPDIGVVTNIYPTHTLFFGDEKGVAREKSILVRSLGRNEAVVLNGENEFTKQMGKISKSKIVWFGSGGDVKAKDIKTLDNLTTQYELVVSRKKETINFPSIGTQFVNNSLAAAGVAVALSFPIKEIKRGLENYKRPEHRMNILKLKSGAVVIDDSYNNNPVAAKEALKTFKSIVGKRTSIVVFGDMLELGEKEKTYHKEIGELISSYKFDYLLGVGKLAKVVVNEVKKKNNKVYWVESQNKVMQVLEPLLTKNSIILIKGSRSIGLDKVVDKICYNLI